MEDLGTDVREYLRCMGEPLTLMHKGVRVDAKDVTFVLAPPRDGESVRLESEVLGTHWMWILDFDCCCKMSINEQRVGQAF
jgi:hypothetical protein